VSLTIAARFSGFRIQGCVVGEWGSGFMLCSAKNPNKHKSLKNLLMG